MTKIRINFFFLKVSKLSRLVFFIIGCHLLTACSLLGNNDFESETQEALASQLELYTNLEPEVQRILALESDMQIIISELNKYSVLSNDPLGSPTLQSEEHTMLSSTTDLSNEYPIQSDEQNTVSSTQKKNININRCRTNTNIASGHCDKKIGIHIAAFSERKYVLPGWLYLQNQLPEKLKIKLPLSATIEQNNITYHSLRLGPFTSANQAKMACDGLMNQTIRCAVTEYQGQRIM